MAIVVVAHFPYVPSTGIQGGDLGSRPVDNRAAE